MSIGKRLKVVRGNMTQADFAELLSVHPNTVARYERDERTPDAEYVERIYKRFNISPRWLLSGIGEMNPLKKIEGVDASVEQLLNQYREAGVMPDNAVSEDEFAVIRLLRFIPDSCAVKIVKQILDAFLNYPPASTCKYLKKSSRRIGTILEKGHFEKGIDIEQKLFDMRKLEDETDMDMYGFEIRIIDLYDKAENKEKFVKRLRRAISRAQEHNSEK